MSEQKVNGQTISPFDATQRFTSKLLEHVDPRLAMSALIASAAAIGRTLLDHSVATPVDVSHQFAVGIADALTTDGEEDEETPQIQLFDAQGRPQ